MSHPSHLNEQEYIWANERFVIFRYPCLKTARFLLQCAVDVNSINAIKNTPLHIFASNAGVSDYEVVLDLLYNHGAHLDQANSQGQTARDVTKNPATIEWFRRRARYSLKCLCARTIQRNHVPFRERITHSLVAFIEKHWRQRFVIRNKYIASTHLPVRFGVGPADTDLLEILHLQRTVAGRFFIKAQLQ